MRFAIFDFRFAIAFGLHLERMLQQAETRAVSRVLIALWNYYGKLVSVATKRSQMI